MVRGHRKNGDCSDIVQLPKKNKACNVCYWHFPKCRNVRLESGMRAKADVASGPAAYHL
jgi:hypothetical protein